MSNFDNLVRQTENKNFPFKKYTNKAEPALYIPAGEYFEIFTPIFEEFEIYGNGPDWDGLVEQAITYANLELESDVDFNSEADTCVIELFSENDEIEIINGLKNIFNNEESLRAFLETVDTSLLDG